MSIGMPGNIMNLSSMNMGSGMNMPPVSNLGGYQNINNLDNLLPSSNNDTSQASEILKGEISKIQGAGESDEPSIEGISGEDPELTQDIKTLLSQGKISDSFGFGDTHSTKEVADSFSDTLGKYLNNVNDKNTTAQSAVETFASGGNIDIHTVMAATEKADLSMQLAIQLRNKVLDAYRAIENVHV